MKIFVYISEATEQTIITGVDHGKAWEMKDGEVYDLLAVTCIELGDVHPNIILMDGRPSSANICTEKDLEGLIVA